MTIIIENRLTNVVGVKLLDSAAGTLMTHNIQPGRNHVSNRFTERAFREMRAHAPNRHFFAGPSPALMVLSGLSGPNPFAEPSSPPPAPIAPPPPSVVVTVPDALSEDKEGTTPDTEDNADSEGTTPGTEINVEDNASPPSEADSVSDTEPPAQAELPTTRRTGRRSARQR